MVKNPTCVKVLMLARYIKSTWSSLPSCQQLYWQTGSLLNLLSGSRRILTNPPLSKRIPTCFLVSWCRVPPNSIQRSRQTGTLLGLAQVECLQMEATFDSLQPLVLLTSDLEGEAFWHCSITGGQDMEPLVNMNGSILSVWVYRKSQLLNFCF